MIFFVIVQFIHCTDWRRLTVKTFWNRRDLSNLLLHNIRLSILRFCLTCIFELFYLSVRHHTRTLCSHEIDLLARNQGRRFQIPFSWMAVTQTVRGYTLKTFSLSLQFLRTLHNPILSVLHNGRHRTGSCTDTRSS